MNCFTRQKGGQTQRKKARKMQTQKKKHQKFKEYETHHVEIFLIWKNNFNPLLNSFSRQAVHGFGPASLNPSSIFPLKCLFPLILYLQFYVTKPKQKTEVDTVVHLCKIE